MIRPSISRASLAFLAALLTACASKQAAERPAVVVTPNRFVLSEAELQAADDLNLYDVIQRLRPTFLRSRQTRSNTTPNPEPVHVFVDGLRAEGFSTLQILVPRNVKEVRFYEPQEANVRFGTGHHGGLIAVTLRR
jgi:hypothetical protein